MEEDYTLARWLNGEMTEAELTAFQKSDDYSLYEKFKEYSGQLKTPAFDEGKMLNQVLMAPKQEVKVIPIRNNRWMLKIAASFVVLLGLTFAYINFSSTTEKALYASNTSFELPDNSKVVLNAGSEIEYHKWNWNNNRKLELNGEAYFRVAKGQKFEVITNLGKVTVLGTQFNVKARENRFDVSCYEGRVKVNYQRTTVIITRGEKVAFANGKAIILPKNRVDKPEWITGELAFEQENLVNIIKELNRQYNITIELKVSNSDKLFSGAIPANNLEATLQILNSVYNLQHKQISKNKFILTEIDVKK